MKSTTFTPTYFAMSRAALGKGVTGVCEKKDTVKFDVDEEWAVELNGQEREINHIPPMCGKVFKNGLVFGFVGPFETVFPNREDEIRFVIACKKSFHIAFAHEQIEMELN